MIIYKGRRVNVFGKVLKNYNIIMTNTWYDQAGNWYIFGTTGQISWGNKDDGIDHSGDYTEDDFSKLVTSMGNPSVTSSWDGYNGISTRSVTNFTTYLGYWSVTFDNGNPMYFPSSYNDIDRMVRIIKV